MREHMEPEILKLLIKQLHYPVSLGRRQAENPADMEKG